MYSEKDLQEIEKIAKIMCGGCPGGKECLHGLCSDWYNAEKLYEAGYCLNKSAQNEKEKQMVPTNELCKTCFHYQVCAEVLKQQLFIKEALGEEHPKCKQYIPATDVVRKSEIVEEIFERIETWVNLHSYFEEKYGDLRLTKENIVRSFSKLKKEYEEGK